MFRNFVKPAAYEKISVRDANGESEDSIPDVSLKSGHVTVGGRQPQQFTTEGKTSSPSTPKDRKISQMNSQESSYNKSMHTTSIYVNGTVPKVKSSACFKTPYSDNCQQQYGNQQQEVIHHQRSIPVNDCTTRKNVQRHSEGQQRPSGNFDEQIRLSNGITDMQIRPSHGALGERQQPLLGSEHEQQRRTNFSIDVQRLQSNGPNYEQSRLSNDPPDGQKPLHNGYNDETKRLNSDQNDAQKRMSSDSLDKQRRQAGGSNDHRSQAYDSQRDGKNRLSSSSFSHKNRLYTEASDQNPKLYAGTSSYQVRLYNELDEHTGLYNSPKDMQNRASGGSISRDLPQRSDQQGNSFPVTSNQQQPTQKSSTEGQQLAPVSAIPVKAGQPTPSGTLEHSPTANESGRAHDLQRRGLYYQSQYNVVPPPPPLFESVFAGLRDIRNPSSIHEKQIVSVKGTVRGFKNRVRAGIATFWAQSDGKIFHQPSADQPKPARNYRQLEHGRIVVYGTSMSVVRETSERCRSVRRLLQNHMVRYEERDLYMSREYQQELRQRLANEGIFTLHLPHVFADGIHIGGAGELEKLNEAGELRGLLDHYQKVVVRFMCEKCGGYRFLPCEFCHGSKRSLLRNHFTEEFCALRCMHCDENGLRRCDLCADQQE